MGKRCEKVTPEMVLAGITELCKFNRDFEQEKDAVLRIYLAMRAKAVSAASEGTAPKNAGGSKTKVRLRLPDT
jgi:hypothetical protein